MSEYSSVVKWRDEYQEQTLLVMAVVRQGARLTSGDYVRLVKVGVNDRMLSDG